MIIEEHTRDELIHYGTPRHSGRYPWGTHGWGAGDTGQDPRNMSFLDFIDHLARQGLSDVEIAKGFALSTTELRSKRTRELASKRLADIGMAQRLRDKGNSTSAIGRRMGIPEPTVRNLLKPGAADKAQQLKSISDMLKQEVDEKKYVDIGRGVEAGVTNTGVSEERLRAAVADLKDQGYTVHTGIKTQQLGTGKDTNRKVLAGPGVTWGEVQKNKDSIQQIAAFSEDGGRSFLKPHDALPIDPKRVAIKYKEDGGDKADGMIYVRRGVPEVSLGGTPYAQVRIQVGDGHYIKGMAMYSDDLPKGVDLQFNTPKSSTGNKFDAMKPLSDDPDLPFGSITRQILDDTGSHVTSVMNIVGGKEGAGEEGGWETWSKTLSSQFLSKQSPALIKTQLEKTVSQKQKDLDEINELTNPTIKKNLLMKFADSADSSAVHLEAAKLSRDQAWHVILPLSSIKPNEVYAPRYKPGTRVVLVRHPHGGTFELPELTVNNRNPEGQRLLGDARDAVGIHHTVAQRLSGADFDGDTVIVIPNNSKRIKTSPALEGLKDFDPMSYKLPDDSPIPKISKARKELEMGKISNLITDMTIKAAPHSQIVRAIRHSMVVIDSEKHNLNFKQSELDNGIAQLKAEYQGGKNKGSSTLISRAGSEVRVPQRKARRAQEGGPIDRTTGRKVYKETGESYTNKKGQTIVRTEMSTKLAETDDAHELSSGTPTETLYANHANKLKAMANSARLTAVNTPRLQYSASAKKTYAKEVASLDSKLALAKSNAPLERHAQTVAGAIVKAKRQANPDLSGDALKKVQYAAQAEARLRFGASKKDREISITDSEWEAIQAGAISNNKLEHILANTDTDALRKRATPRAHVLMSPGNISRAQDFFDRGYTRQEVASALGVSLSTLDRSIQGSKE